MTFSASQLLEPLDDRRPTPTSRRSSVLLIAVAEDDELMREGICFVLTSEKQLKLCGVAADRKSVLELVEKKKPDILLLKLFLHDGDGIDLVKAIAARFPKTAVIVTSVTNPELYEHRLLEAGAQACLPVRARARDLRDVVRGAAAPKPASPRVTGRGVKTKDILTSLTKLTDRELHVFRLIGRGVGTGEIARKLGLSRKTIEYYRERIKTKLGYRDSTELHQRAFEWAQRLE